MRTKLLLAATVQTSLRRLLGLGMVALLIVTVIAGVPVGKASAAAVCTSQADGAWGAAATWDCGAGPAVPAAADDVVINHIVTIDTDQTINNVTVNAGASLTFATVQTLTVSGNITVNSGIFNGRILDVNGDPTGTGGTVVLTGGDQVINANGLWLDFWNLSKTGGGANKSLAVNGGLHVWNDLILKGTDAANRLALKSTVAGQAWQVWVENTYDISDVTVQDSINVSGFDLVVPTGIGLGPNPGWSLPVGLNSLTVARVSPPSITQFSEAEFTATLDPTGVAGTVEFFYTNGGTFTVPSCNAVPVNASTGVALCSTDDLPVGSNTITAIFTVTGGSTSLNSSGAPVVQTVTPAGFTLTLGAAQNPVLAINTTVTPPTGAVSLAAQVNPLPLGGPTTMVFKDNGNDIDVCDPVVMTGNRAVCNVNLKTGKHPITVTYDGVTSSVVDVIVEQMSAVSIERNKAIVFVGEAPVLTASITTPDPAAGTVTFRVNGQNLSGCVNVAVAANQAVCSPANLPPGNHQVSVVYSGFSDETHDVYIAGSISGNVDLTVLAQYFMPVIGKK